MDDDTLQDVTFFSLTEQRFSNGLSVGGAGGKEEVGKRHQNTSQGYV